MGLTESNSSDDEHLVELEDDKLEQNLQLQSGIGSITCFTGWKHTYDGIFHGILGVLSTYAPTLSPKSACGQPDSLHCVTYI